MTGLKEETKTRIKELINCYPRKQAALLPVLNLIQKDTGFVSPDTEKWVAEILDLKPVRVREVLTFYTMLAAKPLGKYHIQICSNLSCSLLGGDRLIDYLSEKLGLKPGETSADGKYTLSTVECLGACEQAPCMMVNFDYYGNLTPEKIDKILEGLE